MDTALEERLRALPPLDPSVARRQARACKICGGPAMPFDVVDFNKCASETDVYPFGLSGVTVVYVRCDQCGFLFTTAFDDWTGANFADFVYNGDYVKVDGEYLGIRARALADSMRGRLGGCEAVRILDYGSGLGIFAEAMAGYGFANVASYDPYSSPERPAGPFDIVTCFEVIEHTTDPLAALRDMSSLLAEGGAIIFSQALQPEDIRRVRGGWWYLAPRNGHVSTFTEDTLAEIAHRLGRILHVGEGLYALRAPNAPPAVARAAARVGRSLFSLDLRAPGAGPAGPAWNDFEYDGRAYRWTRTREIDWRVALTPGAGTRLRVQIPLVNEIVEGFAAGCEILVDGVPWPTKLSETMLVAEGDCGLAGEVLVRLRTPAPVSPSDLRPTTDRRRLGLAVAAYG